METCVSDSLSGNGLFRLSGLMSQRIYLKGNNCKNHKHDVIEFSLRIQPSVSELRNTLLLRKIGRRGVISSSHEPSIRLYFTNNCNKSTDLFLRLIELREYPFAIDTNFNKFFSFRTGVP